MPGINSLLNIGQGALFAEQAAIHVTGNNIANVNTAGYSRQAVRFEDRGYIDYVPGQIGLGTRAAEVIRYFDEFIERSYVDKNGSASRWETQYEMLLHVDGLFNESNSTGLSTLFSAFLNEWSDLSARPDDIPSREALLASAQGVANIIRQEQAYMKNLETTTDNLIRQDVDKINLLLDKIANLNKQIKQHDEPGVNNANTLLDERDLLIRELSAHIDVNLLDRGSGDCTIMTAAGHTLVDNDVAFKLEFQGPKADKYPITPGATITDIQFSGGSYNEYTVEIVTGGNTGDGTSQFRVSLDGGKTWLADEAGNELHFDCNDSANTVDVYGLGISFAAGPLTAGDKYVITPKRAVYWVTPTSNPINISPQIFADGTENPRRMSGGSLAGYLAFRDYNIGQYQEMLNNYAQSMIWEVNRLHSQGVGLDKNYLMQGEYQVQGTGIPLGANNSGLEFNDRLQEGNVSFYIYDEASGEMLKDPSGAGIFGPLDFGGGANFDPSVHTLTDVMNAINLTYGTYVTASITNNQLSISANAGYTFAVSDDTAGLMAGLGLNTFFSGDSSNNIGVNAAIVQDLRKICAGAINGGYEGNEGDNATSKAIAALATKQVVVPGTSRSGEYTGTLSGYYSTIVSKVGTDTATARFNGTYQRTIANDLDDRQQALSGVNLDEEMSNLIKFQNSYKAAAKLISTADQMFQTLLGLKQ